MTLEVGDIVSPQSEFINLTSASDSMSMAPANTLDLFEVTRVYTNKVLVKALTGEDRFHYNRVSQGYSYTGPKGLFVHAIPTKSEADETCPSRVKVAELEPDQVVLNEDEIAAFFEAYCPKHYADFCDGMNIRPYGLREFTFARSVDRNRATFTIYAIDEERAREILIYDFDVVGPSSYNLI